MSERMEEKQGITSEQTFTIPAGASGIAVAAIDLRANYLMVLVKCEDCQFIPAGTSLTLQVGYDQNDALVHLREMDNPQTVWTRGSLPVTGGIAFMLDDIAGARRIRFVLSANALGGAVTFKVRGFVS